MLYYHTLNTLDNACNQINGISKLNPNAMGYMLSGRLYLEAAGEVIYNELSNEILNWIGW